METHDPSIFWYTHIKGCMTFDPDTHFLRTYNLTKIKNSKDKADRTEKRATSYVTNNCVSQGNRVSRDSSVGIVTVYGLDGPGIESR